MPSLWVVMGLGMGPASSSIAAATAAAAVGSVALPCNSARPPQLPSISALCSGPQSSTGAFALLNVLFPSISSPGFQAAVLSASAGFSMPPSSGGLLDFGPLALLRRRRRITKIKLRVMMHRLTIAIAIPAIAPGESFLLGVEGSM